MIEEKSWKLRDIDTIHPYPLNAKKHTDDQVKKVALSISKFGWRGNPIIVDGEGVIIAGHGRRLAALSLGMTKVPVIVEDDMSPDEVRAFRLADNRVAMGKIDADLLREELISLDFDLDGIFDKKELDFAVADLMVVNESVFSDDLNSVMDEQQANTNEKIDISGQKRVPLVKALGFKDILGADQIYVSRFMAQLEAQTSLRGEDAFMHFVKSLVGEISHG